MACEPNLIGTVFVQPQKIRRATTDDSFAALVEDLLNLGMRLATDTAQGGRSVEEIGAVLADAGLQFLKNSAGGMGKARTRLQTWVQVFIDTLSEFGQSFPELDEPEIVAQAGL